MSAKNTKNEALGPDSNLPVYSLRIASQLSGIPSHSIRQYIDKGMLVPYKLDSGRHLFSALDVCRLKNIQILISAKGLNFAGIKALMAMTPCWSMKNCSRKDRQLCSAYNEDYQPCWEASEKGQSCKNENCRECEVYLGLSESIDFKSNIRKLF